MTEYSQNGWIAGDRSLIVTVTVPDTDVQLPVRTGPAGQLLVAAAHRWHREVEPLITPGCWGYAYRQVRGSTTDLSNHASGTAIDLNAPKHPLGVAGTVTPAQRAAIHRIVGDAHGALRWGGDYTGRVDEMHLEIVADEAACAAALPSVMTGSSLEDDMPLTPADAQLVVKTLLATPLRDLYPDKPVRDITVGETLQWAAANAGRAKAAVERIAPAGDPQAFARAVADLLAARLKD